MYKQPLMTILLSLFLFSCGPTIYKASSFKDEKSKIKTLAILPFSTTIDGKRLPKNTSIETIKESQEKTGYDVQGNVYSAFLQKKSSYSVDFQDVDKTNALLKKANLTYDNISLTDKSELCKLLGVDGVISGKISLSKPMSEAGAVAMTLLLGFGGNTNKSDVALTIHQGTGELIWKYDYEASGSIGSSSEKLAKGLMKNVAKKFPFTSK